MLGLFRPQMSGLCRPQMLGLFRPQGWQAKNENFWIDFQRNGETLKSYRCLIDVLYMHLYDVYKTTIRFTSPIGNFQKFLAPIGSASPFLYHSAALHSYLLLDLETSLLLLRPARLLQSLLRSSFGLRLRHTATNEATLKRSLSGGVVVASPGLQ